MMCEPQSTARMKRLIEDAAIGVSLVVAYLLSYWIF